MLRMPPAYPVSPSVQPVRGYPSSPWCPVNKLFSTELPLTIKLAMKMAAPTITIIPDDNGWTLVVSALSSIVEKIIAQVGLKNEKRFEFGKEFEEKIPSAFGGGTTKNLATVEGDTVKIVSQTPQGEQVRIYRLNKNGTELELASSL
jgi:hypothetical protein